jgi:hypothetical protein
MTRNSQNLSLREQNLRRDALRHFEYPFYPVPPAYYVPPMYDPVEEEKPQQRQRSEGNGLYAFLLIVVLAVGYWLIGRTGSGGAPAPESRIENLARVAADSLYLRRGPGVQYSADYILPRGWQVSTQGEFHRDSEGIVWVKVRVETAQGLQEGWVSQNYLEQ